MTPKYSPILWWPQKLSTESSYPIFLKNPKNIEIQNFEPPKMARANVCMKTSEYPPLGVLCPWARHFILCLVLVHPMTQHEWKNCWLGCKASTHTKLNIWAYTVFGVESIYASTHMRNKKCTQQGRSPIMVILKRDSFEEHHCNFQGISTIMVILFLCTIQQMLSFKSSPHFKKGHNWRASLQFSREITWHSDFFSFTIRDYSHYSFQGRLPDIVIFSPLPLGTTVRPAVAATSIKRDPSFCGNFRVPPNNFECKCTSKSVLWREQMLSFKSSHHYEMGSNSRASLQFS